MSGQIALLLLASMAGAPAPIEIVSESLCPTADMVRAALDTLGGASPQRGAVVTVREAAGGVSLTFQWQGADVADVRTVAAPAECQQRARAAAVVIGSWLGALPATPAAPPAASTDTTNVATAPPPPASERRWWLGAGLGAGLGGGVAPGARVEIARGPATHRGVGLMAALQATLPRSLSVGAGTSSWMRPALGVAAFFAWASPAGGSAISGDLGPVAAATVAWGSGYPSNRSDQGASLGVCAGIRLQVGSGSSRPWLELRAIRWLTTHRLRFDSVASGPVTAELPSTEGFFTLGWSLPIL